MPQPIRKSCHAEISGLAHRPQHAAVLGEIVAISGRLEYVLASLLALFSRGSAPITISMFHAVVSTDAQRSMLLAAAKNALAGPELDAFRDLMEDFRPRYGERSRLVHNLWGHSNDHPDKALWWRSADIGVLAAKIAASPSLDELNAVMRQEDLSLKAMTYTVADLQQASQRLAEYINRIGQFINGLMQAHPMLVSATSAATNAPPIGDLPQLNLRQHPQTDQK